MTKSCFFCRQKIQEIDSQNTELLRRFISAQAKIMPPKRSGACTKHQRKLAKAIKRARLLGFLPFSSR